jgi:hypothetical protein
MVYFCPSMLTTVCKPIENFSSKDASPGNSAPLPLKHRQTVATAAGRGVKFY